jgi:hypothetical protein
VSEQVPEIGVRVHLEIEDAAARRVGRQVRGHRIAENGDARELLAIDGAHLDLGHAFSV